MSCLSQWLMMTIISVSILASVILYWANSQRVRQMRVELERLSELSRKVARSKRETNHD